MFSSRFLSLHRASSSSSSSRCRPPTVSGRGNKRRLSAQTCAAPPPLRSVSASAARKRGSTDKGDRKAPLLLKACVTQLHHVCVCQTDAFPPSPVPVIRSSYGDTCVKTQPGSQDKAGNESPAFQNKMQGRRVLKLIWTSLLTLHYWVYTNIYISRE